MYYIGIDGGGTKTAFGLFDQNGHLINEVIYPTSHFLQVGYDGCANIIFQGIQELISNNHLSSKDIQIGIGIAGYGNDKNVRQQLEQAINAKLQGFTYKLTNDMHIALIGALDGNDGIGIVAGTGSIAMAQIHDQNIRCGGWGYLLGDEGSAYWVGKELLKVFCKQADGRVEKTILYDRIISYYDIDNPYQVIQIVGNFNNERTEVAKLAVICDQLASQGEINCQSILKSAAMYLVELVHTLKKHFDNQPTVTYYGGLFKSQIIKELFVQGLDPCIKVVEPIHNALMGAYLLINKKEQ